MKIFGEAGSVQRYMARSGKTYTNLFFLEYVAIYAPSADSNNPVAYCNALCRELAKYKLTPTTPLWIMAQLVRGEIQQVPDPPSPQMSTEQRIKAAENALRWADPVRASMLLRLIARLKKIMNTEIF